jgi:hypothetical protein
LCGAAGAGLCFTFIPAASAGETEKCDGNFNWGNITEEIQQASAFNDCMRKADEQRKADEETKRVNDQQISDAKALASDIATKGVVKAINSAGNTALDRKIGSLMGSDAQSSDPNVRSLQAHLDKAYDKLNASDPVAKAFATTSTEKTVNVMSNAEGQLEAALRSAETLGNNRSSAMGNTMASLGALRRTGQSASDSADSPTWKASVEQAQAQAQQAQQVAEREMASANELRRENAILSAERQDAEIRSEAAQLIRQGQISGWAHAAASLRSSGSSSAAPSGASGKDCEAIGPGHPMC